MSDEVRYCMKCGSSLPVGADFCPECGTATGKSRAERVEYTATPTSGPVTKEDTGIVPSLILTYGILAIIGAVFSIIMGMSLTSMLDILLDDDLLSQDGYDKVLALLGSQTIFITFTAMAVCLIISGVIAIIASNFVTKRTNFSSSIVLLVISSIVPSFTVLIIPLPLNLLFITLTLIGLLMTFLVYMNKSKFVS